MVSCCMSLVVLYSWISRRRVVWWGRSRSTCRWTCATPSRQFWVKPPHSLLCLPGGILKPLVKGMNLNSLLWIYEYILKAPSSMFSSLRGCLHWTITIQSLNGCFYLKQLAVNSNASQGIWRKPTGWTFGPDDFVFVTCIWEYTDMKKWLQYNLNL